ncbi:MAG: nicotinate (nicotinamide) nucleotide adenylyltransferase [Oscillospiraceae bacterium]|nr:nicotinate (nicotinamide) nucleotide adenylyltransferase [Oscillospiraceae bacterium]
MKRILLYGGAFNPPHLGHERILKAALDFTKPDIALITPSPISPHKEAAAVPWGARELMCRCFKSLDARIKISGLERAGKHDKSYTLKTLRRIRKIYGGCEVFLLIGGDMLLSFETWHRYRRILPLCTIVAATRLGDDKAALETMARRLEKQSSRVLLMDYEPLPMSSSEIRAAYKAGEDPSDKLTDCVAKFIEERGLYRT